MTFAYQVAANLVSMGIILFGISAYWKIQDLRKEAKK